MADDSQTACINSGVEAMGKAMEKAREVFGNSGVYGPADAEFAARVGSDTYKACTLKESQKPSQTR